MQVLLIMIDGHEEDIKKEDITNALNDVLQYGQYVADVKEVK